MNNKQLTIKKTGAGKRLDKFLVEKLSGISRSQIQKLIKGGLIKINSQPAKVHTFLKEGDKIIIEQKEDKIKKIETKKVLPKINLDIVAENKNFLVINKPTGIVIHPDDVYKKNTLIDQIIEKYPEIKKVGEDPNRPGIVHRIDKDVSGLLVIAKTQKFYENLKQQFKLRKINKEYTALVYGTPSPEAGIINFPIERSTKGLMAAKPKNESGKKAITEYKTIKKFNHFSLLKLKIHTGRTHQIRVHMKAIGHSIVGDNLYRTRGLEEKIKCPRIFLQASLLGFYDLENNYLEFTSPMPAELEKILKGLK